MNQHIAVIGCGVAGLFFLKAYTEQGQPGTTLSIFEASETMGVGMPYSAQGANAEHLSNIMCQEFPDMPEPPHMWLARQSDEFLAEHGIPRENISERFIFPRLTLGVYMESQFAVLVQIARARNLNVALYPKHRIADIEDRPEDGKVRIHILGGNHIEFDHVVVTTGHVWPTRKEKKVPGYYDSPFPFKKLTTQFNHHVGLMGTSLTAVDAIRTLSRAHGHFESADTTGKLRYVANPGTENFKISMHSRRGLLPGIRFHAERPLIEKYTHLHITKGDIERNIADNDGFLSLDFMFEAAYKGTMALKDAAYFSVIKDMTLEQFVEHVYAQVRTDDPFAQFKEQLQSARESEANDHIVHWKETLEVFFYTLNFHAKNLSAEDMLRLRNHITPLMTYISACLPFDSCDELLALHEVGKLDIVAVGFDSHITTSESESGATFHYKNGQAQDVHAHYDSFIECTGQRALPFEAFPFKTLVQQGVVSAARLKFANAAHATSSGCDIEHNEQGVFLRVPGVAINDNYAAIDARGKPHPRISIMAFAHIQGLNPDVPGIPCCSDISGMVFHAINDNLQSLTLAPTHQLTM
jgi:hypothetical protein